MKLFVYGTLRKGLSNHHFISESECIGAGKTVEKFSLYLSQIGLPMVAKAPQLYQIHGEIYEVSDAKLAQLDLLEGHPNWYKREQIDVEIDGKIHTCWMYFIVNAPSSKALENGDFPAFWRRVRAISTSMRMEGLRITDEHVATILAEDDDS